MSLSINLSQFGIGEELQFQKTQDFVVSGLAKQTKIF